MTTDQQLLAAFAQAHSQDAFRELLLRHQDWVYSVCLRRLPEAGLADDAAQAVFLALAQQAPKLAKKLRPGQLEPWLHQAAKYAAANLRRSHARRQRHEQEAAAMKPEAQSDQAAWHEIEPLLEPALDQLSAADRQVILLRFYRQLSHAEIGTALAITEEAAKKRVNRALERLRHQFAKNGATASSLAIGPLLLAHAVHPVPSAIVVKLASAGTVAVITTQIGALAKGIQHMFHLSKLKFVALAVTIPTVIFATAAVPIVLAQTSAPTYRATAAATNVAQSRPTTAAAGDGPIEALIAYQHAIQSFDAAAFADLVDIENPTDQATALETTKMMAAESEVRASLLKKFDANDVAQTLRRSFLTGYPADATLRQQARVTFQNDEAFVKIGPDDAGSLHFVRKGGKWRLNWDTLRSDTQTGGRPVDKAASEATDAAEISLIIAVRNDIDSGKLSTLDAVEARLRASIGIPTSQP